jgi:hypothetical protein
MTYAVPLSDGSFGIAQAGEAMMTNVIYVALFSNRLPVLSDRPPELERQSAVALSATWRRALNRGDWPSLQQIPEAFHKADFPNERFAPGYVGAKHHDAGVLRDFLCAYHGLIPWNAMHDPAFYDHLLLSGLKRPDGAVLLDDQARAKYRREAFGVDA